MKRVLLTTLIALSLAALPAHAGEAAAPQSGEDKELADLLNVLQQDTAVATKTRLNSDYVPGIVTVLEGSQLEAMGVTTAWDALRLVPGMQTTLDPRGAPSVIVRGLDFPFNSGNIQILVNSIPLTRADSGVNSAVLLIPVEQIERIEVIRGPGSVIYGDFAFMGLVNIITRHEGERAFGRAATRQLTAGGDAAFRSGPVTASVNVAGVGSNDAPVSQLRDVRDRRFFGVGMIGSGPFSLTLQASRRNYDPRTIGASPFLRDDERLLSAEGKYTHDFAPKVRGEARLTYMDTEIVAQGADTGRGHLLRGALQLVSDRWVRHSLLAGVDYSISTLDHATHAPPPPPPGRPPQPSTLVTDKERRITGLLAQDRIELTNAVGLTIGARYDSYSDLHSRLTPRASVVWRVTDHHILKAQYAEGFRPPTFFELYQQPSTPNPRYPFEVNRTSELNYVYKATSALARATIFRTSLSDMIRPGGIVQGHALATGAELEWEQQLSTALKADANVTRVHTADPRATGVAIRNRVSANWLGNAGLLYEPVHEMLLSAHYSYVGNRVGGKGYDALDLTVSRENLFARGLSVRAGVRDAFNNEVTYLIALPTGVEANPYPRRSVWAQISWKR